MYIICERTKSGKIKEIFKTIPENKDAEEIFREYCEGIHRKKHDLIPVDRLRFIALNGRKPEAHEIGLYNIATFTPFLCKYEKTAHGLKFETGEQKKSLYLSRYADQLTI